MFINLVIVRNSDLCPFIFAGFTRGGMSVSIGGFSGHQKRYLDICKSFPICAHIIKMFVNVTYLRSIPDSIARLLCTIR